MTLLHAAIDVSDLETSIGFYREHFGMEILDEMEDDDVRQVWVGYDGEAAVQLRGVDGGPVGPSGVDHLAVAVDRIDDVLEGFEADRIEHEPAVVEAWGIRTAFVTDPDGYVIELIEELEDSDG